MKSGSSKGVVLCNPQFVPILRRLDEGYTEILMERVKESFDYHQATYDGRAVLTGLVNLSDTHGIVAGHNIAAVAMASGLSKKNTIDALEELREHYAVMAFTSPSGHVWVFPDTDPDADFL